MLTLSTPHCLPVTGVALTPGGRVFAATTAGLYFYDPPDTDWTRLIEGNATGPIALYPDGRLVACRSGLSRINVAALPPGTASVSLHHAWTTPWAPSRLAFSPDGREFWADYDHCVRWDVHTWHELPPDSTPKPVFAAVRPGGGWADFDTVSGRLLIRGPGGRLVFRENRPRPAVTAAAYTPDGRTLFVAQKSRVRVFDADTGAERPTLMWDAGRVLSLAVAADGLTAAAGTNTGRVVVWDIHRGS